ncbi:putative pectinesterase 66 [Hordeum vulgare]|nr:putative pectinesterase 66 [Hordeum vulgare]
MAAGSAFRVAVLAAVLLVPFLGPPAVEAQLGQEVEPGCVCEALLRLPMFLVKPQHKYTIRVGKSCEVTYRCGGR